MRYERAKRLIEATILLVMLAVMPLIRNSPIACVGYMALFVFLLRQFVAFVGRQSENAFHHTRAAQRWLGRRLPSYMLFGLRFTLSCNGADKANNRP